MSSYADMTAGVWMTKAELAAARRTSIGSANRLIRRQRWERQPGSDGRTRILVPRPWVQSRAAADSISVSGPPGSSSDVAAERDHLAAIVGGLQDEVVRLKAETQAAQSARRQAELEREHERQAREAAECALKEARQRAEHAVQAQPVSRQTRDDRAAEDRADQVTREAAAAQLRRLTEAMAARRSLGRWARLRAAWRGE